MVNVREAVKADMSNIMGLIRAKAEFDGNLAQLTAKERDIEQAFFATENRAEALVAVQDNKIVGLATYYRIFSTFIAKPGLWLDDLFVYPEYRKCGAGKALMTELCVIAKKTGCCRIDWLLATNNENGRGFYKSIGAKISEEFRHSRFDETAIDTLSELGT